MQCNNHNKRKKDLMLDASHIECLTSMKELWIKWSDCVHLLCWKSVKKCGFVGNCSAELISSCPHRATAELIKKHTSVPRVTISLLFLWVRPFAPPDGLAVLCHVVQSIDITCPGDADTNCPSTDLLHEFVPQVSILILESIGMTNTTGWSCVVST